MNRMERRTEMKKDRINLVNENITLKENALEIAKKMTSTMLTEHLIPKIQHILKTDFNFTDKMLEEFIAKLKKELTSLN